MSPVRLKRRRVVRDAAGAERVLIEDSPLPAGWTEIDRHAGDPIPTQVTVTTPGTPTVAAAAPDGTPVVAAVQAPGTEPGADAAGGPVVETSISAPTTQAPVTGVDPAGSPTTVQTVPAAAAGTEELSEPATEADLMKLNRPDLEQRAANLGVEGAREMSSKREIATAILERAADS